MIQTELEKAIEEAEEWRTTGFFTKGNYCGNVIYSLLDAAKQLSALEAKCAEKDKVLCFLSSVIKSGESWSATCEKEFNTALSSTCGQNYIHKDKVREIVVVLQQVRDEMMQINLTPDSPVLYNPQQLNKALQLAKAEGLIE